MGYIPVVRRWQSADRYYTAMLVQDLFGQWTVFRAWGGLRSALGSALVEVVADYQAGLSALRELDKRRRARGYSRMAARDEVQLELLK